MPAPCWVLPDPESLARELMEGGLSVRQAERARGQEEARWKTLRDPNITSLEASVSNALGLKTHITHSGRNSGDKGEVKIAYTSLEQLDEIVKRLSRG